MENTEPREFRTGDIVRFKQSGPIAHFELIEKLQNEEWRAVTLAVPFTANSVGVETTIKEDMIVKLEE